MAAPVIPPNLTAATAIEVTSLPYSITQDVNFGGTTHTVWYKYVTKKYEYNLSVTSLGDTTVNYSPICNLYIGEPPVYLRDICNNSLAQIAIEQETTYYFKFTSWTGNRLDPCILKFGLKLGPNEDMPAGTTILINDDAPDHPGAFINNSGNVVGFRNTTVPGEDGDVLKDGTFMLADSYEANVVIYNFDATVRTTVEIDASKIGSDHNDKFYVAEDGLNGPPATPAKIHVVSKTGAIINSWTIPMVHILDKFIRNVTGSTDGQFVYFETLNPTYALQKLNVSNGSISTFSVTIPSGGTTPRYRTMFALEGTGARSGEDVLVTMWNVSDGYEIVEYDSLGVPTVVRYYVNITDGESNRLLRAYTSENIVLWTDAPEEEMGPPCYEYKMRWRHVAIDTGDTVQDFRSVVYEGGTAEVNDGCTPSKDFGHSLSCPAIVPPQDIPALLSAPVAEASGIYQIRRGKTNDTVYISSTETEVVKIPDPFIKTSLIGG